MLSPYSKSSQAPKIDKRTSPYERQGTGLKSGCSTMSSESLKDQTRSYFIFKRKLLEALLTMDPLDLLQSGIFEEYESTFLCQPTDQNKFQQYIPKVSSFEPHSQSYSNTINTYVIKQEGLTVTQVERRSRSCQHLSREQKVIRNVEEQRNAQFVIFSNLIKLIPARSTTFQPEKDQCQSESLKNQHVLDEQLQDSLFRKKKQARLQIQELQSEKQQLQKQLRQCSNRLQHQKALNISAHNQKTSRELEFLLKEKQLIKKIQQYKEENENMRLIIQNSQNQAIQPKYNPESAKVIKEVNRIENLKEKVANEGRVRWALSRAWTAQLADECK